MIWSPADVVVRAFANSLSGADRTYLGTALANGTVGKDGRISYDDHQVRMVLEPWHHMGEPSAMARLEKLARTAAKLVSGDGRSGLAYDDIMKVLVQLSNPANISGELMVQTDKKVKGEKDISARYSLHKDNADPSLKKAIQLKERFAEPVELRD